MEGSKIIGGVGAQFTGYPNFSVPSAPASTPDVQVQLPKQVNIEVDPGKSNGENRFEVIKRVATQTFAYPLGNSSFTIYKDKSGQFITRTTDKSTGQVSYYPEPELLKNFSGSTSGVLLETKV